MAGSARYAAQIATVDSKRFQDGRGAIEAGFPSVFGLELEDGSRSFRQPLMNLFFSFVLFGPFSACTVMYLWVLDNSKDDCQVAEALPATHRQDVTPRVQGTQIQGM